MEVHPPQEMELLNEKIIRVKKVHANLVRDNISTIRNLYSVRLCEILPDEDSNLHSLACFIIEEDCSLDPSVAHKVQRYVECLTGGGGLGSSITTKEGLHLTESGGYYGGGEDSSYDSDPELEDPRQHQSSHPEVSRTASDTLGAEFAEYVTSGGQSQLESAGYTARLEFALKLGYTERQVQAALFKLGPNPGQNELLAELIKIGAQSQGGLGSDGSSEWDDEEAFTSHSCELPPVTLQDDSRLRPVVIDGSNVAMSHGNKEMFSCRGIKLCVDWFRARGHKEITVFVPKWRKEASRPDNPITDQEVLYELERERLLVFTPSRLVGGKRLVCYDDRYILRLAAENGGIVVSNDNYRDLAQESPEFRKVVEERILMYSFVNDRFMPPDDPLGRSGPTLDNFLRLRRSDPPPPCPYAKKCTYGVKCKFQHPERGAFPHKTVTERLVEHAQRQLQARTASETSPGKQLKGKSLSLPLQSSDGDKVRKAPLTRTKSVATGGTEMESSSGGAIGGGGGFSGGGGTGVNLHKKLQRQLTLNPGSDPRLWRHQGITRHQSTDSYCGAGGAGGHNRVARIWSAPPAPHSGPPGARPPTSASDPQLAPRQDEARRRLHYHLASIFPEDHVTTAMHLYPTETNPQRICAAILTLFPAKQTY